MSGNKGLICETLSHQQAVLEASREIIITISLDERLIYTNPAGRVLLGITESVNLDNEKVYIRNLHPESVYKKISQHILPKIISQCESWEGELDFCSLKGDIFPASIIIVPHVNVKGEILWLTAIAKNIKTRKELEKVRRISISVADSTIEGIMVTDGRAKILQVNAAFSEITGYPASEILGLTPSILRSNHHEQSFYDAMWESIAQTDRWRGEVWNRRKDGSIYLQWLSISCVRNPENKIENYISVIHDLSEMRAKEAQILHHVNHDTLTGLGNRHLLNQRLSHAVSQAKNQHSNLALLVLDLGRINIINETLGHNWCDRLILEQSKRLKSIVSNADTLVRVGADEFALLVEDYETTHDITHLASLIKKALQAPVLIDNKQVTLSPSIGVTFFPTDGFEADDLLTHAQAALTEAKNAGRDTFRFFDPKMGDEARKLLNLEQALRSAIDGTGLSLHFQPKVCLTDQSVSGVEALVRWHHPELGSLSPAIFIPLAEETGLILEIGAWVAEEACRALVRWRDAGLNLPRVAINVAVQQLEQTNFSDWIEALVLGYGLSLNDFELEVTETGLIHNEQCMLETLHRLKNKGFRIALDDFGTGYSSLSYLRKLPLSTLKIDRSFIMDMGFDGISENIVQTIVQLAKNLNLDLIAEGVEEEAQVEKLRLMGCNQVQGFLYHKPLPELELVQLLKLNLISQ